MELATLANLALGRLIGGIGHGRQTWMEQIGERTPGPLTTLDEVTTVVRRLLRGERVTFDGREVRLTDALLDQPPSIVPPLLAGVRGAKSLALAGRVADGVVLAEAAGAAYVSWAVEQAAPAGEFQVPPQSGAPHTSLHQYGTRSPERWKRRRTSHPLTEHEARGAQHNPSKIQAWLRHRATSARTCRVALSLRTPANGHQQHAVAAELLERIVADADVCFGRPTIRGHRAWVSTVLGYLAEGWTTEAVLVEFPALDSDDVRACLAYAAQLADTRFADLDIGRAAVRARSSEPCRCLRS